MKVIKARNVNQALARALLDLSSEGTLRSSRNGTVLAFQEPVATVYEKPTERVLFSPIRNANPAFHLTESLWMLAGRNDVKFPGTFVKNMKSFSDNDTTFWGAYGHRWINYFGWDQITAAIHELSVNPESRRVVVAMWNAADLGKMMGEEFRDLEIPDFVYGTQGGLDVPCNTHIYFDRRNGKLNMTVCCRSNDILWGCYGANAVHMSILQEYMALAIGCEVGTYTQMSNDLHLYSSKIPECGIVQLAWNVEDHDHYSLGMSPAFPMPLWGEGEDVQKFDNDNYSMFDAFDRDGIHAIHDLKFETRFFSGVVQPMIRAWAYRKTIKSALQVADTIQASDWSQTMTTWLSIQGAPK